MIKRQRIVIFFGMMLILSNTSMYALEKTSEASPDIFNRKAYLAYIQGLVLENEGKYEEALKAYSDTIMMDPQATYVIKNVSALNLRIGNLDAALEAAQRLLDIDKNNLDSLFLIGSIYILQNKKKDAEDAFRKVIEINPKHIDALIQLAALVSEKNPHQAINYLERVSVETPESLEIWYELGLLYAHKKKGYQRAIDYLQKVIEREPRFALAYAALGQLYEDQKKYKESIIAYEKYLEFNPDNTYLLAHLGILYLEVGSVEKAESIYQRLAKENTGETDPFFWLSIMAEEKKEWSEALSYIIASLKKDKNIKSLMRLGYYYVQLGDKGKAMDILREVKSLTPQDTQIRLFLAYGYQELGFIQQAIEELHETINIDPQLIEAQFQLGVLYDLNGLFFKAIEQFRTVLSLKADYAPAANYLGYSFADRDIHIDEAEKLITSALKNDPENVAYIDSLGWVYFRQARYADALTELVKASQKSEDPTIYEHVGDAQWAIALASEGPKAAELALQYWNQAWSIKQTPILKQKIINYKIYGLSYMNSMHKALDSFFENQKKIKTIKCFASYAVDFEKKRFSKRGLLEYHEPAKLHIDIGIPMIDHVAAIDYTDSICRITPELVIQQLWGIDQTAAYEIVTFLTAYFKGTAGEMFLKPDMVIRRKGNIFLLENNVLKAQVNKKTGMITACEYVAESGQLVKVQLKKIKKINTVYMPAIIEFFILENSLRITIKLKTAYLELRE